jgi:uncharacterized protein YbbC (DUF1343 family)
MITDPEKFRSVTTSLHIFDAYMKSNPDSLTWTPPEPIQMLEYHEMGVENIIQECEDEIQEFLQSRETYFLYK